MSSWRRLNEPICECARDCLMADRDTLAHFDLLAAISALDARANTVVFRILSQSLCFGIWGNESESAEAGAQFSCTFMRRGCVATRVRHRDAAVGNLALRRPRFGVHAMSSFGR